MWSRSVRPALPAPVVAAVSGVTLGRCSEFGGQLVDGAFPVVVLAVPPGQSLRDLAGHRARSNPPSVRMKAISSERMLLAVTV